VAADADSDAGFSILRNSDLGSASGGVAARYRISRSGDSCLGIRADAGIKREEDVSPAVSSSTEKSLAVLPFDNLSRDPDNAYFAEGIQEEILSRLAKIADLKVISRTSTQRYQSKPGNLAEIAKQLGVANILEGSVQKAGDQVRVNVQLVNAQTDSHLWAETVSNSHNRWAEETARRALAAAKFPPLPKSVIQQSGTDLASFDYQLDLDEPR
jgi:TolB-like protein